VSLIQTTSCKRSWPWPSASATAAQKVEVTRRRKTGLKPLWWWRLNTQIKDGKFSVILKDSLSDCVCKHAQINTQWNISKRWAANRTRE
jgi:hypothetical protein